MIYFYEYLAFGAIILIAMAVEHHVLKSKDDHHLHDLLQDIGKKRTGLWNNILERVVVPVLAILVTLIGWPVVVYIKLKERLTRLKKAGSSNDTFLESVAAFHASMSENGYDLDELPEATGEFGHDADNPIPTLGITGSHVYLKHLFWDDGTRVAYNRTCSVASMATETPVDCYKISHPNDDQSATLYLSPYQKRNSLKAPKGFTLSDHT